MSLNRVLSVMIPAFNEERTLEVILNHVLERPEVGEVIAVDDGSTDGTWAIISRFAEREPRVRAFRQEANHGKGAALRRAISEVRMPFAVVQDADLEYDPRDYPKLLEPILEGRADVVYGSRFLGGPQRVHYFWHYVANKVLTLLSDLCTNLKISDMETCYKVFRKEVLQGIQIRSNRFGFEPEITAKIAKHSWRVYEVPITYAGRTYEEGKKITWKDGVQALWCIVRFKFSD